MNYCELFSSQFAIHLRSIYAEIYAGIYTKNYVKDYVKSHVKIYASAGTPSAHASRAVLIASSA